MKKEGISPIFGLIGFLEKLMRALTELDHSLEENMKLLEELEKFQCIVYDREQAGQFNYRRPPTEVALCEASVMLRSKIATQLSEKNFPKDEPLEKIFEYFEYASRLSFFSPFYEVKRDQIINELASKTTNHFAEILLARINKKDKWLMKETQDHYNGSEKIYQKIAKILAK